MSRLDRQFADLRARAIRNPITRANRPVGSQLELTGGLVVMLTFNL